MKIIDILNHAIQSGSQCLSFEYYPPKDRTKWPEFYEKITRMSRFKPSFIDVTWGTGDPTSTATLEISDNVQNITQIDTMMHLTCTHRSKKELLDILQHVHDKTQIRNVMALRGNRTPDKPWAPHPDGFLNASELVAGIRQQFGQDFSISVAGYPEGHREDGLPPDPTFIRSEDYYKQIEYLRRKIDAGADFIVTQLCFDMDQLCRYRDDCAKYGIQCPIVPGILPIHNIHTWEKIAAFSASIPDKIKTQFAQLPVNDAEALDQFAINLLKDQMDFLHTHGFNAIHIYTLNHEKIISKSL